MKTEIEHIRKLERMSKRHTIIIVIMCLVMIGICSQGKAAQFTTTNWDYELRDRVVVPTSPILCESGEDISHTITEEQYEKFKKPIEKRIDFLNSFEKSSGPVSIFDVEFILDHTNIENVMMRKSKISVCMTKKDVEKLLKDKE